MDEGKLGKIENNVFVERNNLVVKDSWFDAYIEANITVPQSSIYIKIVLAIAILEDPPGSWNDYDGFYGSSLPEKQFLRLSEILSKSHASKGVRYGTSENLHNFNNPNDVKIVTQTRIHSLWENAREDLIINLSELFLHKPFKVPSDNIEEFFKNPDHLPQIKKVIEILKKVHQAFHAKPCREWLKSYRDRIINGIQRNNVPREQTFAHFINILRGELQKMSVDINEPETAYILSVFQLFAY